MPLANFSSEAESRNHNFSKELVLFSECILLINLQIFWISKCVHLWYRMVCESIRVDVSILFRSFGGTRLLSWMGQLKKVCSGHHLNIEHGILLVLLDVSHVTCFHLLISNNHLGFS